MTGAAGRVRRTQAERTTSTRAALLDATIECLFELGYAGTTTTEIAARAAVSRGAQLHHFPTRQELVTSAVEHLFARRHREFLDAIATLPPEADRLAAVIDLLWSMVSGPTFYAWLELTVAARTDPELRARVAALTERFSETVVQTFRELFEPPAGAHPFFDVAPRFAFALMDGLALERILQPDDPEAGKVLDVLKAVARLL